MIAPPYSVKAPASGVPPPDPKLPNPFAARLGSIGIAACMAGAGHPFTRSAQGLLPGCAERSHVVM